MNIEELKKVRLDLDELLEYTNHMNDEYGEYCNGLYYTAQNIDMMSPKFSEAFVKELDDVLVYIRRNTEWVDKKETIVNEYRELEWNSYD